MEYDTIILGAGIAGLTAAYELSKKGKRVLVLEKEKEAGGIARSFEYRGFTLEHGPHSFWGEHKQTKKLIKELGLEKNVYSKRLDYGIWYKNKVYNYSSIVDIARLLFLFKRLPVFFIKIMLADKDKLKKETAEKWLISEIGKEEYESFFKPLLLKRFRISPKYVSALDLRTIFKSAVIKGEEFHLKGGFGVLAKTLEKKVRANGSVIKLNYKVVKVKKEKDLFVINEKIRCKRLISTIPVPVLEKISSFKLPKIKYFNSICMYFGLRERRKENMYVIVVADESYPFQRISDATLAYFKKVGKSVITTDRYIEKIPKNVKRKMKRCVDSLDRIYPGFSRAIEWSKMEIVPYAVPVTRDYAMPKLPEGLFLVGHFDRLKEFAGVEKAVISARRVVKKIY